MKINKQERKGNTISIEVETEYSALTPHIDHAYKEAASEIKVPGFRQGKVPANIIKQYINEDAVLDHAIQELIADLYPKVIKETNIEPVDYPRVNIVKLEKKQPFIFNIEVDLYPEVKVGKYKAIKVSKPNTEVTEKEVDDVIESIRNNLAATSEVKSRGIQEKDVITLDVKAECEGKPLPQLSRKQAVIESGKAQISLEFDEQLMGLKPGESKQFAISMPAEYFITELAGKEVKFDITIKELFEKVLPPLDDNFAKTVSKAGTVPEMKEELRNYVKTDKERYSEQTVRDRAVEKAADLVEADIPEGMIEQETGYMIDDLDKGLRRNGSDLDTYMKSVKKNIDGLKVEFRDTSIKRVKAKLFLRKLIEDEKLTALPEDIDKEIEEMAKVSGKSPADLKKEVGEGGLEAVQDFILRKKAVDHLVANIKIEVEKGVTK